MADLAPAADPGACDIHDRGVTPERLTALQAEAHAFNHLLLVTEDGHKGPAHKAAVEEANKDFYAFMPGKQALDAGSYEASKAFYEQVTELPIGERKKLLELTRAENEDLHAQHPKMPVMSVDMGSDAFINSLDFHLGSEEYTFHYLGMCAEVPAFDPTNPPPHQAGWNITLPTFNIRR